MRRNRKSKSGLGVPAAYAARVLLWLSLTFQEPLEAPSPAHLVAEGREQAALAVQESAAGHSASALEHARAASKLRPMHGGFLVLLAQAAVEAGAQEEALAALSSAAAMGFAFNLRADDSLASLYEATAFAKAEARMRANHEPIVHSEVAFRVTRPGFHAEGVAHDPQSGDFFLSSFDGGEIVRVHNLDGIWTTELFADLKTQGFAGAYGMSLDASRQLLYVAGGASRGKPGAEDLGGVVSLQLSDGVHRRIARRVGGPKLFGDACVAKRGEQLAVFATDPIGGAVFSLSDGAFDARLEAGRLSSPQGLVALPSAVGQAPLLVIADYAAGLFTMRADDPTSLRQLGAPADACLLGLDGLALHGDSLIAIQNGVSVFRVLRLRLDEARENVRSVEVLERAHPLHGEPTLGVVVGNDFYYVANAPWGLPEDEEPPPTVILRLPLK